MAKSVVGLNIKIGANVATLQRDLGKASGHLRKFGANAKSAGAGVTSLSRASSSLGGGLSKLSGIVLSQAKSLAVMAAATVTATLSIRGLADAFARIDKVAKLSDITGASTESLVAFRKASELAGIEVSKFDVSFKKMLRSIGEAKSGTGEALEAFKQLGLSAADLANDTPEEAFTKIAEAINGLGTQSEKAAAAADIFGRSGVDLLPMLSLGRSGLEAMRKEVDGLGQSFSRVDAAKVEEANDAITRMKAAFEGLTTELAIALAPAIVAFSEAVASGIQLMRQFSSEIEVFSKIGGFGLIGLFISWSDKSDEATTSTGKLADAMKAAKGATDGVAEDLEAAAAAAEKWKTIGDSIRDSVTTPAERLKAKLDEIKGALDAGAIDLDTYGKAVKKVQEEFDALKPDKWTEIGERIKDAVATPTETLRAKLQEIRGALNAGAIDFETYGRAVRNAVEEFGELNAARDSFNATPAVGAAVRGTAGGFAAVQDGQRVMKDLAEFAKKREASDKRKEKLLDEMLSELEDIAKSVEDPIKVKEHDIV